MSTSPHPEAPQLRVLTSAEDGRSAGEGSVALGYRLRDSYSSRRQFGAVSAGGAEWQCEVTVSDDGPADAPSIALDLRRRGVVDSQVVDEQWALDLYAVELDVVVALIAGVVEEARRSGVLSQST